MDAKDLARFWSSVDIRGEDECWEWKGSRNPDGYGKFRVEGRIEAAHRIVYRMGGSDLTDDLLVRHECDHPWCVNPAHLLVGTHLDNMADAVERRRIAFGERVGTAKLTDVDVLEIVRLYRDTPMTAAQIGKQFGVTKLPILMILNGKTWRHIERPGLGDLLRQKQKQNRRRGSDNNKAELTEDQVKEIVARFKTEAVSAAALAQDYGVSAGTVKMILAGKTWQHLKLDLPTDRSTHGARHWTQRAEGETRECRICGKPFQAKMARHYFCSDECSVKSDCQKRTKRVEAAKRPKRQVPCKQCGMPFPLTKKTRQFCSDKCQRVAWRAGQQLNY